MAVNVVADGEFDVIVVGGGSAGCVLASRLSEDPLLKVLLVEAGVDTPPGGVPAEIMDVFPKSYADPRFLWPDLKARMKGASPGGAVPGMQRYEQARVMGGGSSLMGMYALRGLPGDYEEWENAGAAGWGWDDVLPYFRKLERDLDYGGDMHGANGPYPIRRHTRDEWPPFCAAVAKVLTARGQSFVGDLNASFGDGVGPIPMSNLPHQRVSAAMAYLTADVRKRSNLRIEASMCVEQLLLDGRVVRGLRASRRESQSTFIAREVIVSAGALHSPALLLRAGIGPAKHLAELTIPVVHALPGVGNNLQNHPRVSLSAWLRPEARQPTSLRPLTFSMLRYSSGLEGCGPADMLMGNWNRSGWHPLGACIATLHAAVYKPYSRGTVKLASPSCVDEPQVDFNALSDSRDLKRLVAGLRFLQSLMDDGVLRATRRETFVPRMTRATRMLGEPTHKSWLVASALRLAMSGPGPLRRLFLGAAGVPPPPASAGDAEVAAFVHATAGNMFHPVGTCRMGAESDPDAVVDPRCRVHGIAGLRVVDGSVMPTLVRANTNLPITMIAERAADMVRRDLRSGKKQEGVQ